MDNLICSCSLHPKQVLLEDVKKVLLKTPSGGFALFEVDEFVMNEDKVCLTDLLLHLLHLSLFLSC
jgi:hypothetical protein